MHHCRLIAHREKFGQTIGGRIVSRLMQLSWDWCNIG